MFERFISRFRRSTWAALVIMFLLPAAHASAGHWVVVYTFTGDGSPFSQSFINTTSPAGSDLDPLHGRITVHYDAISTAAPISGARIVSGFQTVDPFQPGVLTITGMTRTDYLPGAGGVHGVVGDGGALAANRINFSPIPDTALTGYLHCTAGFCGLAGFTQSVQVPQTPTTPGPFPLTFNDWIFTSGTAGVGKWNSPKIVDMITFAGATITVETTYAGREISRVFMPEAGGGLVALLTLAALHRTRRR